MSEQPSRYAPSAWAVLRSGAAHPALTAAAVGGAVAFFAGAVPAGSIDGEPAPGVVVSAECPPEGFLPDGQPCVVGPVSGDPSAPSPAAPPAPDPAAGAPQDQPAPVAAQPPPAEPTPVVSQPGSPTAPAPTQLPPAEVEEDDEQPAKAKPKPGASAPTRLGRPRVERKAADPGDNRPRRARPDRDAADSAPAANGSAGLPGLTFDVPAAARAVPDVLLERFPIPPFLLPIYQAAGTEYDVPWQILAAINEIETDYGRNLNVSSAGAMGWMQFIPSSWKAYGVDANEDGRRDPYNPVDAIFAAARYLKAAGAKDDLRRAIFAYNHADWYVESVLLRAKLIRALPPDLVGALTGLTQGRFPVAGRSRYPKQGSPGGIVIDAREGAPVVAVNDGVVKRIGASRKLGHHLVLQDVYGNRYTYAHLGEVASRYAAPRAEESTGLDDGHDHGHAEHDDPKPRVPASAGSQPRRPVTRRVAVRVAKERLFAHPARPASYEAGGAHQLDQRVESLPAGSPLSDWFVADYPIRRKDMVLRALRPGAQVVGGTILGRAGARKLHFRVRPAGRGAPAVDPRPILDGWRLLESTEIYRGKALAGMSARNPSIGQLMLMSKEALARRVLADKRIEIYECGRRDVATGITDRRVLIGLAYLASSGLKPYVSALQCGHSYYTSGGSVSWHSSGNAVDIAAINGKAILGNQGKGSITDVTVRRLLSLQGVMSPGQIITLMSYPGHPNAFAMSDHHDHIHVGWQPRTAGATTSTGASTAVLKPRQWSKLVDRLGRIQNPRVPKS